MTRRAGVATSATLKVSRANAVIGLVLGRGALCISLRLVSGCKLFALIDKSCSKTRVDLGSWSFEN